MSSGHYSDSEEKDVLPGDFSPDVDAELQDGRLDVQQQQLQEESTGDGVRTRAPAEKKSFLWDGTYQERPLQLKDRSSRRGPRRRPTVDEEVEEVKEVKEVKEEEDRGKDQVKIHGLSVEKYQEVYYSVLTPAALSALSTDNPAEYTAQVLELKRRLWAALCKPRLLETVGDEDGRVHITETYDLT